MCVRARPGQKRPAQAPAFAPISGRLQPHGFAGNDIGPRAILTVSRASAAQGMKDASRAPATGQHAAAAVYGGSPVLTLGVALCCPIAANATPTVARQRIQPPRTCLGVILWSSGS
jgi:hypothetical protein